MSFRKIALYWIPVALWMGVIFWVSTQSFSAQNTASFIEPVLLFLMPWISQDNLDFIHVIIRKCGHLIEYFILGLLLFRAFRGDATERRIWQWTLSSLLVVLFYAASDEFHQSFVTERTASLSDIVIDTAGGIFAQAVVLLRHHANKLSLPKNARSEFD